VVTDVMGGVEPAGKPRVSHLRLLAGQLVQGVAHRGVSLLTVGGETLADRTALQGDEPPVDARAVGVDPDDVAPVVYVRRRTPSNAPPSW
jgi:hypothetical protein